MPPSLYPGTRWRALDVFRGSVVLGMILVNAADLYGHAYPWLQHARFTGFTFADAVFPGFLFIMGVAMGVSLHGHVRGGVPLRQIYPRIVRRSLVLFALGLLLNALDLEGGLAQLRVMGVLQRLGLCYLLAAPILLHLSLRAQTLVAAGSLLAYTLALALIPVPPLLGDDSEIANNLPAYIDRVLIGPSHLLRGDPYNERIDPEGLLGTLPSIVNVLFGAFAGRFLASSPLSRVTSLKLFGFGVAGLALAFVASFASPINKALWTSSFVLLTSGVAAIALSLCYEWVDVLHHETMARPLEVLGMNAIGAYLLSSAIDALVSTLQVGSGPDVHSLYEAWLRLCHLPPAHAAFLFALLQALLVWAIARALHARGWYLKV